MPLTQKKSNSKDILSGTNRTAIDFRGRLGTLYDGYRDIQFGKLNVNNKEITNHVLRSRQCLITNGSNHQRENILKMVNVQHELRLSMILKLAQKTGIAQIIDYSDSINKYTRFFAYSYLDREEQLSDTAAKIQISDKSSIPQTGATHIITGIRWGIDVIIILQLPHHKQTVKAIDNILQKVRTFLLNSSNAYGFTSNEENLLEEITLTKIYSNIPDLNALTRMSDACRYMLRNKNSTIGHPISYTLQPIKWLYPQYTGEGATFIGLPEEFNEKIEQYVLKLTTDMSKLETSFQDLSRLLCGYLKERLIIIQNQWTDVKRKYTNEIDRLAKLVIEVRSGRSGISRINQALDDNQNMIMKNSINDLIHKINNFKEKGRLIIHLDQHQFQYWDVTERGIDKFDNEMTIEFKLVLDNQYDRVLCSTDILNTHNSGQLEKLRDGLVEELTSNANLRLIYADFSYCSLGLHNMLRLPKSKYDNEKNTSKQKINLPYEEIRLFVPLSTVPSPKNVSPTIPLYTRTPTTTPLLTETHTSIATYIKSHPAIPPSKNVSPTVPLYTKATTTTSPPTKTHMAIATFIKSQPTISPSMEVPTSVLPPKETHSSIAPPSSLPTDEIINILLLGETGVGKSTFINALANYLTFNTLAEVQKKKPVVLIPVSFLITVGDNFEERTVKFGDLSSTNNENFSRPGQSVTQKCKSYVFDADQYDRRKIRIIDTPGFGDTRGVDQDDRNMEHILEYIKNLSHLNAVCFLLKPNESRLNIFFRSCLTQLFSLLGPNARNNIIFCFTNARSTFFTPGNTAPLLKNMLASLTIAPISFKKENTFCFDNESFRYLVALQDNITFNDHEKHEYEMSWTTSVRESSRLLRYICEQLTAYRISH